MAYPADLACDEAALYRHAFDATSVGLAILTPDGTAVQRANRSLCQLLGYPPGALDGIALTDLAGARGCPLTAGIRCWRTREGASIDVRVQLPRHEGGADRAHVLVAVIESVDADEIVRAEQNRDALVAAGLGEWRWEAATGDLSLSRRAGQILGCPPGRSVTWDSLRGGFDPDEIARWHEPIAEALGRGSSFAVETRFRRSTDGAQIVLGLRGQQTLGADGSFDGIVGVVQDITTRVAARRELAEREQRLRVATSITALGIFEWHVFDDRAIWENEHMFAIFGRTEAEGTIGRATFLNDTLHPDDREGFRTAIRTALREERNLHATGRIRRHADGAWRTIEMAGQFVRETEAGPPRRMIGVVADITERSFALERQTLLIRELHHRVKNTLATVQAIVGSTARTANSIDSFYEDFVGRIKSLSYTHSVLTEDAWQTAGLRGLLASELKPYAEGDAGHLLDERVTLHGPDVDLPSEIAVPIGMAFHELTTNAAKYGALSNQTGRIRVVWEVQPGGTSGILVLEWRESEGPRVASPSRQGFGSRLLQRVLSTQVQAQVETEYAPDGFRLLMRAPLPDRNATLNPLA